MRFKKPLLCCCFVVACSLGVASEPSPASVPVNIKSQPDSPLQITRVDCTGADKVTCTAKVRNGSAGDLTAYGLVWRFVYGNGKFFMDHMTTDKAVINPRFMHPGEVVEEHNLTQTTTNGLSHVEVEVDFVIPLIGRAWGNTMSSPGFNKVLGFRSGYNAALDHLRDVYSKGSVSGIRKELGVQ